MRNIIKITVFGLLAGLSVAVSAQNNADGKGLVDRRVTLDNKAPQTTQQQTTPQNGKQNATAHRQQPAANSATVADSAAKPALPSKYNGIEVKAKIDSDTITIGDQTTLHITIDGIEGQRIELPSLEALGKGTVEALESECDTLRDDSGKSRSIEQRVTITSFEAGLQTIDNIIVRIADGGKIVALAPEELPNIFVAYAADADTVKCETKADADYIAEPYTFWEIARWAVYALLLAAAVFAIVWILKRRKEHKPILVLPGAKPVPADKRALNELESLRRKELWQKGRIKKYYTDMTDIVRRFLRNMYGISAAEMTTRQTLAAFHGISDWSEESESLLRQLLQKADMVKFAKMEPEMYEHDLAMQNAVDFVRKVAETHRINNPEKEGDKNV